METKRKGIVLAGGAGTRLYPVTQVVSKQLLPVYDKPMIYYPLSTLMKAGIREIAIICNLRDLDQFKRLLGDGSKVGCRFEYIVQENPNGIAEAFVIAESFIAGDSVALILGDNIFYGDGIDGVLRDLKFNSGGLIFAYHVAYPERYGVVEFDGTGRVISLEEKPERPKSDFAVPGLYFYDKNVVEIAKTLKPSARGELEITDLSRVYLQNGKLNVKIIERGTAWLDTGEFDTLIQAGNFVEAIENRQGLKVGCIEEVAYRMGFIGESELEKLALGLIKSPYGKYLMRLLK